MFNCSFFIVFSFLYILNIYTYLATKYLCLLNNRGRLSQLFPGCFKLDQFEEKDKEYFEYDETYVLISGFQIHIVKQILDGIFISVPVGDKLLK